MSAVPCPELPFASPSLPGLAPARDAPRLGELLRLISTAISLTAVLKTPSPAARKVTASGGCQCCTWICPGKYSHLAPSPRSDCRWVPWDAFSACLWGLTLYPHLAAFKITESKEFSPFFPTFFFPLSCCFECSFFAESKWKPKGMGGVFPNCAHYHPAVFWLWFRSVPFLIKAKIEGTALVLKNCFLPIYPCSTFIKWIKNVLEGRSFYISMKKMQPAIASERYQILAIGEKTLFHDLNLLISVSLHFSCVFRTSVFCRSLIL